MSRVSLRSAMLRPLLTLRWSPAAARVIMAGLPQEQAEAVWARLV